MKRTFPEMGDAVAGSSTREIPYTKSAARSGSPSAHFISLRRNVQVRPSSLVSQDSAQAGAATSRPSLTTMPVSPSMTWEATMAE